MEARLKGGARSRKHTHLRLVRGPGDVGGRDGDTSARRLERLRRDYLRGSLNVDSYEVARRMLIRLLS